MIYQRVPWLAVAPWSQIAGADGYTWTVLPHWPAHERRIVRRGRPEYVFAPGFNDLATQLVPDDADALRHLRAAFGLVECLAREIAEQVYMCPPVDQPTMDRHLRNYHPDVWPAFTAKAYSQRVLLHEQAHARMLVFPPRPFHLHERTCPCGHRLRP